jgi:hypothetical protein
MNKEVVSKESQAAHDKMSAAESQPATDPGSVTPTTPVVTATEESGPVTNEKDKQAQAPSTSAQMKDKLETGLAGKWLSWEEIDGYHRWTTWEVRGPDDKYTVKELNGGSRYGEKVNDVLRYHSGSAREPYYLYFTRLKGNVIRLRDIRYRDEKELKDAIPETNTLWYRQDSEEAYEIIRANARVQVEDWVTAIASGDPRKTEYIEEVAEQMRSWPSVVRYLVYQLSQTFDSQEVKARVRRRVARLLAEMSEGRSFTDAGNKASAQAENRQKIKTQLINHAVPLIVARLPTESDLAIRRDLATVLGKLGQDDSIGGFETVNALVRAVVSDEKARVSRQEMLSKYYLEPSWEQSRQAANILEGAVKESKRTLVLLQTLNVIIFLAGMAILVGGLYISVSEPSVRVEGALVGLGGLAGVITLLVNDPLNRIQNSLSNLVQLESAFTSFIWELTLNSTYIQSQYVAAGRLEEKDIAKTLDHIEGAMDFTLSQVAAYTEEGREVIVPHLTQLSPVVGQAGETITIYGSHLHLTGRAKEKHNQIVVAINHVPCLKVPEKLDPVKFNFPAGEDCPESLSTGDETAWISLIIDNVETNALPLHVLAENKDKSNGQAGVETAENSTTESATSAGQNGSEG